MRVPRIDYINDTDETIMLKQREQVVRLQAMLEDSNRAASRLTEAVTLIEAFLCDGQREGKQTVRIVGVRSLIRDAFGFFETGEEPPWQEYFTDIAMRLYHVEGEDGNSDRP